jgi:hypothetical protein
MHLGGGVLFGFLNVMCLCVCVYAHACVFFRMASFLKCKQMVGVSLVICWSAIHLVFSQLRVWDVFQVVAAAIAYRYRNQFDSDDKAASAIINRLQITSYKPIGLHGLLRG